MLSGPYVAAEGWYWNGSVSKFDGPHPHPVWWKRTGRDVAHCLLPVGQAGSVLFQNLPDVGPPMLGLYDMATGNMWWGVRSQISTYALSAGKDLVFTDSAGLTIRGALTGVLRGVVKGHSGTPYAASRGYLLVAQSKRQDCLN